VGEGRDRRTSDPAGSGVAAGRRRERDPDVTMPEPSRAARPIAMETAVQIAGYAGAIVAIVGIAFTIGRQENVGRGAFEALFGAIAAVLLAAGFAVGRDAPDSYQRMRSVFWAGSLEAFTGFVATISANDIAVSSLRSTFVTIALASGIYAWVLYLLHRRLLQQFFAFQAVIGFVAAITFPDPASLLVQQPSFTGMAILFWLVSAAWLFLGYRGMLPPRRTSLVLGAIGLLLSPLLFTSDPSLAEFLVLLSACGLIAIAGVVDDWAVAAIGIAGLLFVAAEITRRHFSSTDAAAVTSFVVGSVLLAGAIIGMRWSKPASPPPSVPATPTMPASTPEPSTEPRAPEPPSEPGGSSI
jgi:hypothetical protein